MTCSTTPLSSVRISSMFPVVSAGLQVLVACSRSRWRAESGNDVVASPADVVMLSTDTDTESPTARILFVFGFRVRLDRNAMRRSARCSICALSFFLASAVACAAREEVAFASDAVNEHVCGSDDGGLEMLESTVDRWRLAIHSPDLARSSPDIVHKRF